MTSVVAVAGAGAGAGACPRQDLHPWAWVFVAAAGVS